jgi:hypothetical protein
MNSDSTFRIAGSSAASTVKLMNQNSLNEPDSRSSSFTSDSRRQYLHLPSILIQVQRLDIVYGTRILQDLLTFWMSSAFYESLMFLIFGPPCTPISSSPTSSTNDVNSQVYDFFLSKMCLKPIMQQLVFREWSGFCV